MEPLMFPDLAALPATQRTAPGVELQRGFSGPTAHSEDVASHEAWHAIEIVFCRAFPELSRRLYELLGEGVIHELDD